MAEALIAARRVDWQADLPDDDGIGAILTWQWARGHIVVVKQDGHPWGALEDPRNFDAWQDRRFALIRFPGVPVARIARYLAPQRDGQGTVVRQRLWQIQWAQLPQVARDILRTTGVLTVGSAAVGGDFTWAQVQAFVVRLDTAASDTDPL
jgi:hypothetical protein